MAHLHKEPVRNHKAWISTCFPNQDATNTYVAPLQNLLAFLKIRISQSQIKIKRSTLAGEGPFWAGGDIEIFREPLEGLDPSRLSWTP